MRFVLLANPQSRRLALFQSALASARLKPARVVAWSEFLAGRADLSRIIQTGDTVRLESPGKDFEVERALLAAGANEWDEDRHLSQHPYDRLDAGSIQRLSFDKGRILYPRQWYLGFRAALREVRRQLHQAPSHRLLNDTDDVATMFDKRACHARLWAAGVAVPRVLPPICGFDDLLMHMRDAGWGRVFVKLAHGSSGSGVVALQIGGTSGTGCQAVTTVEMVRQDGSLRLYNSRRLLTYREPGEIKLLIDALARHRVHVEQWIPKAGISSRTFDLRVVVTGERAGHAVVRLSRSPITNLHLLNDRANPAAVRVRMGEAGWHAAMRTCEQAMSCFPGSLHGGVDLAVAPDFRRHAVLEVNAFGDLLPGVLHGGRDTYTTQIAAVLGNAGGAMEAGAVPEPAAIIGEL